MAFTLGNFYTEVRARLQDQSVSNKHLSDADLRTAARAALLRHTVDMPQELLTEFVGDGSQYYPLGSGNNLASWSEGISSILWIDYPAAVIASDGDPNLLDERLDWTIFPAILESVRTLYLYFPNHNPSTSETMRIAYTAPHTLNELDSASATTILDGFEQAFYHLGAGYALLEFAGLMAPKGNPIIQADVTDHNDVTERLRTQASKWFREYFIAIGLDPKGVGGTGTGWIDWDIASAGRRDLIFHGRRSR